MAIHPDQISEQLDELASYAELGVSTAIGHVPQVWEPGVLEKLAIDLIPAAARL